MNELVDGVREIVAREIAPRAAEVDLRGELPEGFALKLGERGLAGLALPEGYGGVGADLATFGACLEALGGGCASSAWALVSHSGCARALLAFGADAQKERLLPALAAGRLLGSAMAGTEAAGGSSAAGTRTRARRDGDGWVLDGNKEFISLAGLADLFLVMARTGDEPLALGCFLVEKSDPGVSFGRREELLGVRGLPVGGIGFAECRLPAERLLGAEAGGLAVMGAMGAWGLVGAAAASLGIAAVALADATAYVKERVVAGASLSTLPGVQRALGELAFELAGARAHLAQAIRDVEGVKGPPLPLFRAKLAATEAAVRITDRAMALYGAAGYSRALPAERRARDVRAFTIHFANNEVLKDMLSKAAVA
ncbi:MAG: acyl-CoA dehydrogenase family protein [Sorangiineae bacterium]|nr:acyl-CoA dehydrogenase family protein [Polyangiaceae bacterium]MEB2323438.1 acyl-CoA dehydrogenase family protein [Sorangiineae bacterium]